jgi:hypothetical protein
MNSFGAWATYAVVLSVGTTTVSPKYSIQQSSTWTAIAIFLLECLSYALYKVVLYPRFFSPFRSLPQPSDGSFFNGQWRKIWTEPAGNPHRKWINSIPNNGIIRYLYIFNEERLLLTSPSTIREALVTKSYSFTKTDRLRTRTQTILGNGLLTSEGDEHKVGPQYISFPFKSLMMVETTKKDDADLLVPSDQTPLRCSLG